MMNARATMQASADGRISPGLAAGTRASPRWSRELLWIALILPLLCAPLLFGAPRLLAAAGTALALWRLVIISRRWVRSRQYEVDIPLGKRSGWTLLASLALVLAPHTLRLPWWLTGLVLAFMAWRIAITHRRLRPPPRSLLIALVSAASAGVFLQYGTLFGREAGVALLSIMIALKLLELKTRRDAVVMVFLAYFLVITNFLYSQTLPTAALMLVAVWLITATMIGFQHREPRLRHTAVLSLQLLGQAVPLMVVLFLFFPRMPGPLWGLPRDATQGVSGLSDSMSPGSFSQLSASSDVAFRVEFAGQAPRAADLYWRGPVFWQFDGRNWTIGHGAQLGRTPSVRAMSEPLDYTVTLEPHHERWMLALDMPVAIPGQARISNDHVLLANTPVRTRLRYESRVVLDYRVGENETEDGLQRGLQLPPGLNPRTRALAERLQAEAGDDRVLVESVLRLFRSEPFYYTTSPPLLTSEHSVDEFLFESRRGFCEHYASSFTVLMRAAGIPARVVTGYQGGVINPVGNYLVVRQAEAHAWTEVWLRGEGWVRIDPTAAVSPSRVEDGIAASIAQTDPLPMMIRGSLPLLSQLGFTMDAITNSWNQWVLSYNTQRQQQLLRNFGLENADWRTLSILLLAGAMAATLLAGLLALRALGRAAHDPVVIAWERLCRKLARAGLPRSAAEGPTAYARRVAAARPDLAGPVGMIAECYVHLRYGPPEADGSEVTRPSLTRELHRHVRSLKT